MTTRNDGDDDDDVYHRHKEEQEPTTHAVRFPDVSEIDSRSKRYRSIDWYIEVNGKNSLPS